MRKTLWTQQQTGIQEPSIVLGEGVVPVRLLGVVSWEDRKHLMQGGGGGSLENDNFCPPWWAAEGLNVCKTDMTSDGGAAAWPHARKCALRDKLTLIKRLQKFPRTTVLSPSPNPGTYEMLNSFSFWDKNFQLQFPNVKMLVDAPLQTNTGLEDIRENKSGVQIVKTDIFVQLLEWSLTTNRFLQLYIQINSGKVHLQLIHSPLPPLCATSPLIYGRRNQTSKESNWKNITWNQEDLEYFLWLKLWIPGTSYPLAIANKSFLQAEVK